MAYVPGTEIDKPAVDLTGVTFPPEKVHLCKKALRRAGVPEEVIANFIATAVNGNLYDNVDAAVAAYVDATT